MTEPYLHHVGSTQRLSERQSECLRLLARGRLPKEIACDLGLSVETVHAHLKAARRTLAVGSSRQAARMLAEAENAGNQDMGTHVFGMATAQDSVLPSNQECGDDQGGSCELKGTVSDSWPAKQFHDAVQKDVPPRLRGRLDDMTPLQRSLMLGLALVAAVIIVAGLAATATSLQSLLWSLYFGR